MHKILPFISALIWACIVVLVFTLVVDNTDTPPTTTTSTTTSTEPIITGLPAESLPTGEEQAFITQVHNESVPVVDDAQILEYGYVWCDLMEQGMTDVDVVSRINEGAADEQDRTMHFSVVLAGIEHLCPSQHDKAEYIALNYPLPAQ